MIPYFYRSVNLFSQENELFLLLNRDNTCLLYTSVYDRAGSAIAEAAPGDIDWEKALEGVSWFHISGITPAISKTAMELSLEGVKAAKQLGITVSCDLNFRKNLWKYGKRAAEVMREMANYVDVAIANEEDVQKSLEITTDVVEMCIRDRIMVMIYDELQQARALFPVSEEEYASELDYHHAIVQAIKSGDSEAASNAMRIHLDNTERIYSEKEGKWIGKQ